MTNTISQPPTKTPEGDTCKVNATTGNAGTSNVNTHEPPNMTLGHGWFAGKDGAKLFEQWWLPENPKAAVAIVHGYSEHSGRYAHVAESFVKQGYAVYSYDHRAHGQSEGENTFIRSFDDFVDDFDLFMQHIQPKIGSLPFFVLGHSMGGLITSLYMASRRPLVETVKGVVLTGPYLQVNDNVHPWLVRLSSVIGTLFPKLPTIGLDYTLISRDPEMLERHQADPLIYRGKMPARTGAEFNRAIQQIQGTMEKIIAPLLVMHGGADQIAMVSGSHQLYARATNQDKTLKIYDGLYHEILNEIEREEVKADIIAWMDERYAA